MFWWDLKREVEGMSKRDMRLHANFPGLFGKIASYSRNALCLRKHLADRFFSPFRKKKEQLTFSEKSLWTLL